MLPSDSKLDGAHPAADMRHRQHIVPMRAQGGDRGGRERGLGFDNLALRPDAWRLDGLLQRHAVIDQVHQRLHCGTEDAQPPR